MKFEWFGNDTIALLFLGASAIMGLYLGNNDISLAALSAIAGFTGHAMLAKKE